MRPERLLLVLTASLGLLACQAEPKLPVPTPNPPVAAVQNQPEQHNQQVVTWGGSILQTLAQANHTEVVLLSKPLDRTTRPHTGDANLGRFIARIKGFLDPAVYQAGRELSVHGRIQGIETRKIGEFEYRYPLVEVDSHQLWPVRVYYEDDYWYDPWYPWYGPWYYPYPYHSRSIKKAN